MPAADLITCPHCAAKMQVKSAAVFGKTIRCPKCREGFRAEAPERSDEDLLAGLDEFGGDFGPTVQVFRPARDVASETAPPKGQSAGENRAKTRRKTDWRLSKGFAPSAWPLFGLAAGAVAGGLWVLVAHSVHGLAGYVAWLVGLFVGLGVRVAAGPRDGWAPGLTAVATTAFVLLVAKFIVSYSLAREWTAYLPQGEVNEQTMVLQIARKVADEHEAKGTKLDWPNGNPKADAATPEDYPDVVWLEAQARWDAKTPELQKAEMRQAGSRKRMLDGFAVLLLFISDFQVVDSIWIALAMFTAFKIGSGASD